MSGVEPVREERGKPKSRAVPFELLYVYIPASTSPSIATGPSAP